MRVQRGQADDLLLRSARSARLEASFETLATLAPQDEAFETLATLAPQDEAFETLALMVRRPASNHARSSG
jgi:hypothetical protein